MNKFKQIVAILLAIIAMAAVSVFVRNTFSPAIETAVKNAGNSDVYFPLVYVSNPATGIKQIIISLRKHPLPRCKLGLENVWQGVKSGCKECVKLHSQCYEELPVDYQPALKGMKYLHNYVLGSGELVIFISENNTDTVELCRKLAAYYSDQFNRDVQCILAHNV